MIPPSPTETSAPPLRRPTRWSRGWPSRRASWWASPRGPRSRPPCASRGSWSRAWSSPFYAIAPTSTSPRASGRNSLPLKIGAGDVGDSHGDAKEVYPEECAGVLVGMDTGEMKVVVDVWRAENTHEEERSRRFLIEPLKIKEFEERAAERDMDVLGFYHSHPDHPAEPSEYDREHAWPGYSYVIASVSAENVEEMRSWVLRDDRSGYDEEPLLG